MEIYDKVSNSLVKRVVNWSQVVKWRYTEKKECYNSASLERSPIPGPKRLKMGLPVKREPLSDYEEKNGSALQKRADFQNFEPFWLSFFSQCSMIV